MKKIVSVLLLSGIIVLFSACSESSKKKMADDMKDAEQAVESTANKAANDTKDAWNDVKEDVKDTWDDAKDEFNKNKDKAEKKADNVADKASDWIIRIIPSHILDFLDFHKMPYSSL